MTYFPTWKIVLIVGLAVLGVVFAAPNLLSKAQVEALPGWLPHRQISLGLDLQGGSHLLFDVDTGALIRERVETMVEAARAELRKERIRYEQLGIAGNSLQVTIPDPENRARAEEILSRIDTGTTLENDAGRMTLSLTPKAIADRESAAIDQSLEIIRRRIDETGVREPTIQRQGQTRILVQLPGIDDPDRVKRLIGKTAKMTFHLVDDSANLGEALGGRVPPGDMLLPMVEGRSGQRSAREILVNKRVLVSGENLLDAEPTFQQNEPVVSFRFDTLGGRRFGEATAQNVGKSLAIVLDGQVISAPRIREPILGGSGVISGNFTVAEAGDLALLLRAGALPAPLTVVEERTVGAGLGADSIAAGKLASIVGVILVGAFMVLAYGFFGILADLAVVINIVILLGALSLLQATLTLPGIAGIVLTVGMAVDANVLIYEHIREEVRNGRTPLSALDAGFSRALTTIIDSNLTTLIAGVMLYAFGSGTIRGFAVTLSIGIMTTMFTAVTVTRLMVMVWYRRAKPQALPI